MQTTMIVDENIRLKGFNLIVSETEFLILSIALSRMADSKYVNDKDRVIAERMHNDLYEVGADMAGVPQTDLVQDSPNLVKDLVEDYEPYKYEIKALHKDYQEPYCEIADTPQTECDTCRHYKPACELFSEVCKYEPTTQTETENSNLTFEKVMEEIQTQVIEFPDTHQKFTFARKIEMDGDSIKIGGWEYKGVKDAERFVKGSEQTERSE